METKVLLFNDRSVAVRLRVIDEKYDPADPMPSYVGWLKPGEAKVLTVYVPDDHILYIKDWNDIKMVSTMPKDQLTQFVEIVRL